MRSNHHAPAIDGFRGVVWIANPNFHGSFVLPKEEELRTDPFCPRHIAYKLWNGKVREYDLFYGCTTTWPNRQTGRAVPGLFDALRAEWEAEREAAIEQVIKEQDRILQERLKMIAGGRERGIE